MVGAVLTLLYDEARRIWYYRWLVVATMTVIIAAAAIYVLFLPDVYDASAQIYVDKEATLASATQGVSLAGDNSSIAVVEKTLLNDQNLDDVLKQVNPAAKTMAPPALASAAARLRSKIQVSPDQGDGFFEIRYADTNPVRAQTIVQLVVNRFISANIERSRRDLDQAGRFLDAQIATYETMMSDSQVKMADFRKQHPGFSATALPPLTGQEIADVSTGGPYVATQAPAGAAPQSQALADANQRVAALQSQLTNLRTQYTDQYPDVVSTRRQLDNAIAERTQAQAGATAAAPSTARRTRRVVRRQTPVASPELQSQWTDLARADEVLHINYEQLIARREATRMSQAAYGADSSGKYEVTRPAVAPMFPSGPNRSLYMTLAVLFAAVGGVGVAYLRGAVNGIFVSPREVEEAFRLPVVGTLSWEPAWDTLPTKPGTRSFAMFAGIGLVVALGLTLFVVTRPFDLSQLGSAIVSPVLHSLSNHRADGNA
jgi:uncharacterized protein involved in exopolysaccharide biosynthesis